MVHAPVDLAGVFEGVGNRTPVLGHQPPAPELSQLPALTMLTTTDTMHAITTKDHLALMDIAASFQDRLGAGYLRWTLRSPACDGIRDEARAPAIARAGRFRGARAFADDKD